VAGLTGRAVDDIGQADWIVDDVVDTGKTSTAFMSVLNKPVWGLFDRDADGFGDADLAFPWEVSTPTSRQARIERLGEELLLCLGYNPASPELRETPARWASWWSDFLRADSARMDTTFEVETGDQVVILRGVPLWSVCEHHLLPFQVEATVAYIPKGRVVGLSKLVRVAQRRARRLQLQERMIREIADDVCRLSGSIDVGVVGHGRHMCMEARGVSIPATTTSVAVLGAFRVDAGLRAELLLLSGLANAARDR
jgi:GTP cyclohydrolase I